MSAPAGDNDNNYQEVVEDVKQDEDDESLYPFESLESDEDKVKWMMSEYQTLQQIDPNDKLDFSAKTSLWIAYERSIESSRKDRLFNDPYSKSISEIKPCYGKRLSIAMMVALKVSFDPNE